nr:MAG TPA: hypothetical protein [Caudoviricetes sp.]
MHIPRSHSDAHFRHPAHRRPIAIPLRIHRQAPSIRMVKNIISISLLRLFWSLYYKTEQEV